MPELDFYHGLYSGQQVDEAVSRALVGGQLDQDIAAIRAAVGSPLVANTAADMTNINKIYVYTGSEAGYSTGHWYYYENGSWQDGGLYNSAAADSAMSPSSTNAVQNKVIKAYVDGNASSLSQEIMDAYTELEGKVLAEKTRAENVEALKAPLASPALTGTPTAPTASPGDNSTKIATTAYVDAAVLVEKTRAEAVEATKADQSFAEYILLREEEDRQILFGSIVEAAEDTYDELRSSPIHTAITIGQSVYPRMDRTRMAIDRLLGRTVAFNQLIPATAKSYSATLTTTGTYNILYANGLSIPVSGTHVYMISADLTRNIATNDRIDFMLWKQDQSYLYLSWENGAANGNRARIVKTTDGIIASAALNNYAGNRGFTEGDTLSLDNVMLIDLTAQYGTTLADSIYAMEQATTGAGVAYVRQRLDLDYYAANAGTLTAPVVSGVSFVGFNVWDEDWEVGAYNTDGTKANTGTGIRSKTHIPVFPNTTYYLKCPNACGVLFYDASKAYLPNAGGAWHDATFTTPSNAYFMNFYVVPAYGTTYNHDICINLSNPSRNGEYEPYHHVSLSIPSTRLDGVGSAQDVLFVREDGENDYSLILANKADEDAFSAQNWSYEPTSQRFYAPVSNLIKSYADGIAQTRGLMCDADYAILYSNSTANYNDMLNAISTLDKIIWQYTNNSGVPNLNVKDTRYTTVEAFVAAMGAKKIAYELATPTETVIAEHLTLADISAIAQNGGVISIVNENGHIVQPDMVCDVVVSRSAS